MEDTLSIQANTASTQISVETLGEIGFMRMPGPFSADRLPTLTNAYDRVMAAACGPDLRMGSTTTRMSDLLNFSPVFDEVFLHKPLLEACGQFIGEAFKLSSLLGRTLRAGTQAQELHADLPQTSEYAPLLGFILMIDPFREENGATRFVTGSQKWPSLPTDRMVDTRAQHPNEVVVCGEAGTMILFDAATWHGHTANVTSLERRSIQGYFVRRSVPQTFNFRDRLSDETQARMTPISRYLLALDEDH